MEPLSSTLLLLRRHTSRAVSVSRRVSGGRSISLSVDRTFASGSRYKYGDCSSWIASACFNVPSNTLSPVVLVKSERTMVFFCVGDGGRVERHLRNPMVPATTTTARTGARIFHRCHSGAAALLFCEASDAACTAAEEPEDVKACSAARIALLVRARFTSESRFNRCNSARISEACW